MKFALLVATATAMMVMNARAEDAPKNAPDHVECYKLADVAKDLGSKIPGQFVKMTHDQTMWARGYYVGSPPQSQDPSTEEAYFWQFPKGDGVVFFAMGKLSCASMTINSQTVSLLLDGGT